MLDFSIKYLNLLNTKLKGLNLTKILDPDEFYNKQILDSIYPYLQDKNFKDSVDSAGIVVDVGFGGGFPILPLANLLPNVKFVGVETRRKKVDAVRLLTEELGLKNVSLVHSRIEDFCFDMNAVVTFKAVGTTANFLPLINTTKKLKVFFYKGPSYSDSEQVFEKNLADEWTVFSRSEISVPHTEKRLLIGFQNKNVPRGTSKTLVKLSEFLP